jgi:hypothetical protein
LGVEPSSVQLDNTFGKRQPDAETACRVIVGRSHLHEHAEDLRQIFR